MDITNLQNFLVNQTPMAAFAEKNSAPARPPQQKTSFASKLNNAVERSASGISGNEAAKPPANMEKPVGLNNENNIIAEPQPKQTAEDSQTDGTAIDGGQPLANVKPEIPDEFLGAASMMVQMPPAANIISENIAVQPGTAQGNFFPNLFGKPGFSLTAEDLKGLTPDAKILETILRSTNGSDKGQIISQAVAKELLIAAKQDMDVLAAKGELPKIAEVVLPQSNGDTAKELLGRLQPVNPEGELAKPETELLKNGTELTRPGSERLKQEGELVKPGAELLKPGIELAKPADDADVAKPAVEIAKLTVIDAAKPAVELSRPNEQPQSAAGEATSLTPKETADAGQNLADRQNTAGQQSFAQTMESKAGQIKNPDQPLNMNNGQTFAVSFDAATQNTVDKPGATPTPQTTADFLAPRDEFQVKAQIVQQATLINRSAQESEMIIRLKPEHLGEMALKVTVTNGVVSASFHSNNAEVRGILENSVQQLKNDLANAGFKVDNVSISAGLSQFTADQEHAMQWQQQQTRRVSGKNGEAGYAEAVESIPVSQQVINSSKDAGVDYRI